MTLRDPEKAIGIDKEITSALPINFTGENLADCKETNIVSLVAISQIHCSHSLFRLPEMDQQIPRTPKIGPPDENGE